MLQCEFQIPTRVSGGNGPSGTLTIKMAEDNKDRIIQEQAAEIERLRTENAFLLQTLETIGHLMQILREERERERAEICSIASAALRRSHENNAH